MIAVEIGVFRIAGLIADLNLGDLIASGEGQRQGLRDIEGIGEIDTPVVLPGGDVHLGRKITDAPGAAGQPCIDENMAGPEIEKMQVVVGVVGKGMHRVTIPGEQAFGGEAVARQVVLREDIAEIEIGLVILPPDLPEQLPDLARGLVAPAVLIERVEGEIPVEIAAIAAVLGLDRPAPERASARFELPSWGAFLWARALAIDALLRHQKIYGLVLLSPAIRLRSFASISTLACAPVVRSYVLETDLPPNPVKYKYRVSNSVC